MLKKLFCFLLCFAVSFSALSVATKASELNLSAQSAVLINAETGEVIYEKNAYEKRGIASTTKIMSSIVAIETGDLSRKTKAKYEDVAVEGTSIGLKAGDSVSLDVLVKGMLLESGNDAANVTATLVAGDKEKFSRLMNKKAEEIGMKSTSFVNPSGLTEENHFSTAYDMALLGAYAIKNELFCDICSASKFTVSFGTPERTQTFYNHNKFLYKFDGALGIKTGFTKAAGRCLVTAAERDGVTLVAVTLKAPDDWNDHIKLMEYGFERVKRVNVSYDASELAIPVVGSDVMTVGVELSNALSFVVNGEPPQYKTVVYAEKFLYPYVEKGECVGWVEVEDTSGKLLCSAYLLTTSSAKPLQENAEEISFIEKIFKNIKEGLSQRQA